MIFLSVTCKKKYYSVHQGVQKVFVCRHQETHLSPAAALMTVRNFQPYEGPVCDIITNLMPICTKSTVAICL